MDRVEDLPSSRIRKSLWRRYFSSRITYYISDRNRCDLQDVFRSVSSENHRRQREQIAYIVYFYSCADVCDMTVCVCDPKIKEGTIHKSGSSMVFFHDGRWQYIQIYFQGMESYFLLKVTSYSYTHYRLEKVTSYHY